MAFRLLAHLMLTLALLIAGLWTPTPSVSAPAVVSLAEDSPWSELAVDERPTPGQSSPGSGDAPAESPGLLPSLPQTDPHHLQLAAPRGRGAAPAGPPFLAGPLRPPCASGC
ncbi:MAG: hypothetical protein KBC73_11760 [Burkholderiaceae bacterium]|nr:hypothetical protein [Burkholderiaceae bacterium]